MRILVIEDDEVLRDGIAVGLGLEGFEVDAVATCADARLAAACGDHSAAVVDIGLPDGSGLTMLADWRRGGSTLPVILLTARDMISDKIDGLEAGADDYLGKPFDLGELAARLRAITRRAAGRATASIIIGRLAIDEARRRVTLDGEDVPVSRREFSVIHALAERPGHVLSRSQLEDHIYGWQEEIESNTIEVHIHKLRAKLGRDVIETVRGQGYRIVKR